MGKAADFSSLYAASQQQRPHCDQHVAWADEICAHSKAGQYVVGQLLVTPVSCPTAHAEP
jgi:hypothetical protein